LREERKGNRMKIKKIIKVSIVLIVVALAGFILIDVMAQGNRINHQGKGQQSIQSSTSVQQGVMDHQREFQGNILRQNRNTNIVGQEGIQGNNKNINNQANCDCNCCLTENIIQEKTKQRFREQKRSMEQSQELNQP